MAHALIFDSGVGGLSVAREIRRQHPTLQMTYVADDEFRPYGEKTDAQLRERLPGLLWTLTEVTKADLAVIACNTASTSALSHIREILSIPVIGVVPAVKPAATHSTSGRFAVLGTPGTVRRKYVDKLISDFAPDHDVILEGSTRLVTLAEDKLSGHKIDLSDVKKEIAPIFKSGPVDSIVLACTHFPLLRAELAKAATELGAKNVRLIDSGEAIARRVGAVLGTISDFQPRRSGPDIALLIGLNDDGVREKAFANFGFCRVVGLLES